MDKNNLEIFSLIKKHREELRDVRLQGDFETAIWKGFNEHFGRNYGGTIDGVLIFNLMFCCRLIN